MRRSGALDAPVVGAGAHVCWRFDDEIVLRHAVVAYLAEGLARRERVAYVADRPADDMRSDVAGLGAVDRLVGDGALVLRPVRELYEPGDGLDAEQGAGAYRHLLGESLRDGHRGLRVAADATTLVTGEVARRRLVQHELAIDRVISTEPVSALCAYDGRALGPAVGDLFAVHPLHHGAGEGEPPFQAYYDAGRLCLTGEVDMSGHDQFAAVLEFVRSTDDRRVDVDLGGLEFIDARSLARLARLAAQLTSSGRELRIVDAAPIVRRCCELLGFEAVVPVAVVR